MGKVFCKMCEQWRHIAEADSGERIHLTGDEPTEDACWWCGFPVSKSVGEVEDA